MWEKHTQQILLLCHLGHVTKGDYYETAHKHIVAEKISYSGVKLDLPQKAGHPAGGGTPCSSKTLAYPNHPIIEDISPAIKISLHTCNMLYFHNTKAYKTL